MRESTLRNEAPALLAYLPAIELLDADDVVAKPCTREGNTVHIDYEYHPTVARLLDAMAQEPWQDPGYDPEQEGLLIEDDGYIARASFLELRRLITYMVRGERFAWMHFGEMVESGRARLVLQRLGELAG